MSPRALLLLFLAVSPALAAEPPANPTASTISNNVPAALRDNSTREIPLLIVNYDPILRGHNGVRLSRHLRWNDPRAMSTNLVRYLREASGGFARYQIAGFLDIDAFPQKRDGFRYTEETFLAMWKDRKKAHQADAVSYAAIFQELNLVERVRRDGIREVWVWGAPYFGTDEYAMKIPGDQVFYPTDNPWFYRPYDIPDCGRTVWVMGFNYEVGEDNALHSYGHRCEGILGLTVARGIWDAKKTPTNVWNRFTRQSDTYPENGEVGNVHGGPNAKGGYDYGQTNAVLSGADDWFNYPHFTGAKTLVNCDAWGRPYHLSFQRWWLNHLPKSKGRTEGFYNNWWRYIADYDDAVKTLPPPGGTLHQAKTAMY